MSSDSGVLKEGWATKQGGFIKTWHRRWFVLIGKTLEYSKQPGVAAQGQISLDDVTEIGMAFQCKKGPALQLVTRDRTYFMVFEDSEEVQQWIDVLNKAKNGGSQDDKDTIKMTDFKTLRVIGQGLRSQVLLVKHITTGKTYIAKRYSKKVVGEQNDLIESYKSSFKDQSLPYAVNLFDIVSSDDSFLLIMDTVPCSLKAGFGSAPVSPEIASAVFAEIVKGLQDLHDKGFYFGDFHLSNVLLDKKGHVKLTLPGVVLPISDKQERYLEYIDPIMLESGKLDSSSDFYGAGIIFYEMLTGYSPFITHNRKEILKEKKALNIEFPPYVSDEHKQLIMNLLSPDLEKRKSVTFPEPSPDMDLSKLVNCQTRSEASKAFENESFENDTFVISYADESAIMQAI